jgi:hypothetical protein
MAKDERASVKVCSAKHTVSLDDALELAKLAQITGSGFREIAREIAGPFWQQISSIFHGHYLAVYLLTDPARRHVWHAHLSCVQDDAVLLCDAIAQSEMLHRFLHDSSEDLITAAFESCAATYLRVLKRFPTKVERDVTVFNRLHQLLSDHPHLGRELCNQRVSAAMVTLLTMLPAQLKQFRVAELFECDPQTFHRWMEVYRVLTGVDDLSPTHTASLLSGEKPGTLIQRCFHAIEFPGPVLPNTDRIQHLHNGEAMVAAANRYENCLRNWIGEAHRGEQQFYEVVLADGDKAILSLKNDAPAGWVLEDVKLAGNADPDDVLQDELREYLAQFGVRVGPTLETMMRRFARHDLGEIDVNPFEVDAHLFDAMDDGM